MPNFKTYNYDESSMVIINYRDQFQLVNLEYAIHHLIEHKLDLSIFSPNYTNDKGGRKAYDPAILFTYSQGITSDRVVLRYGATLHDHC